MEMHAVKNSVDGLRDDIKDVDSHQLRAADYISEIASLLHMPPEERYKKAK